MLNADQLDALTIPITDLYEKYMTSVIEDMARRLSKMGMSEATAWQMQRMIESGAVHENALRELAKLTGESEAVLKSTFEKAGVTSMRFDDAIYRAAGLEPLPLNLSPAMQSVMVAGFTKTGGIMTNLTMTTALDAQRQFIAAADLAYMQVSTGAMSYSQAIEKAVHGFGNSGLFVNYPSGHRDRLDVAMRRTVLTGVSQTTGQLQITRMEEMGVDLVQTSAHIGARPSHALWQGLVFSRSGSSNKYPDFVEGTGYGTGGGLGGYNCRHSFYPFFEGISESAYTAQDLEAIKNETVTYNGKEISIYDATQEQRYIERNIREWKRIDAANKAAGLDEAALRSSAKVMAWENKMEDFVIKTGLSRLKVDGVFVRESIQ